MRTDRLNPERAGGRKHSLPSPPELEATVRTLCQDALAIYPMYRRLHSLGLEPRRGENVHVSGGGIANTPPNLAIESRYAESRRNYARWVASELAKAAESLDKVRQGLEEHIGPGAGYRQPKTLGSDAIVTMDDFAESLDNQAQRLRAGIE